jgi:hypothetical protein
MPKHQKNKKTASFWEAVSRRKFRFGSFSNEVSDRFSPPSQVRLSYVYNGRDGALRDLENLRRDVRKICG